MNIHSWRDGRFILAKDSLLAMAARLGFMSIDQINELPIASDVGLHDGWCVDIHASKGIGGRIRHTLDINIWNDIEDCQWKFTIDVLGQNQCKNCYFPEIGNFGKDVDTLSENDFNDICYLPEVFADFVATLLLEHHRPK
ncbi:hypothetical protein MZD04_gp327 [Pseudomonas phage Psa21]|uniref:Uncharacterized protein n=1 Tax=Pseudomonas phage Psa21 TaxID=2530023 RepID=A0A481W640_9CAUD|nr:hypothetical protein MZD04_gp327 [Pseudomonas phage Psa21]QBJ02853.1 hypothetical protein PSA21_327 [Pseudomonas phage Psa21]